MEDELEVKITEDSHTGKTRKLLCARCRTKTNQIVEKSITHDWNYEDAGIQGSQDMLIMKCMGCDSLSFCKISKDSETYIDAVDENGDHYFEYTEEVNQYPSVNIQFKMGKAFSSMPSEIKAAYKETYEALCNGLPKLAAAGARIIVELVCLTNNIKTGRLVTKIDKLHSNGVVTEPMKEMLHNVRLFGNENIHTSKTPDDYELYNAWEAVNTLLQAIYGTADSNRHYKAFGNTRTPF